MKDFLKAEVSLEDITTYTVRVKVYVMNELIVSGQYKVDPKKAFKFWVIESLDPVTDKMNHYVVNNIHFLMSDGNVPVVKRRSTDTHFDELF